MNFATFLISLITSDEADVLECPNLPSNEFYSWIIYELCYDIGKQHFWHWYTIYTWNMSFTITLSPMPCCVYGFLGANSSAKEKTSIGDHSLWTPAQLRWLVWLIWLLSPQAYASEHRDSDEVLTMTDGVTQIRMYFAFILPVEFKPLIRRGKYS